MHTGYNSIHMLWLEGDLMKAHTKLAACLVSRLILSVEGKSLLTSGVQFRCLKLNTFIQIAECNHTNV